MIDASFTVEPGQIFVVMGLSGSGKSTLLRMLNGLLEPTAGQVRFDGQDLTALSARASCARSAPRRSAWSSSTSRSSRTAACWRTPPTASRSRASRARSASERAAEALELAGLAGWEKSWPDELSGGMQQRVGLARALATDADLLLMDESFSALDPLIRRDMQDQLLELQKKLKKTIVFITHDLNEAMRLGDRIAVMRDGRIVQIGTAEDILVTPANDYVASFTQDVDRSRVLTAGRDHGRTGQCYGTAADGSQLRTAADVLAAAPATVGEDTPSSSCSRPCSTSGTAVAVTDEDGELIGVVPRAGCSPCSASPCRPPTTCRTKRRRMAFLRPADGDSGEGR